MCLALCWHCSAFLLLNPYMWPASNNEWHVCISDQHNSFCPVSCIAPSASTIKSTHHVHIVHVSRMYDSCTSCVTSRFALCVEYAECVESRRACTVFHLGCWCCCKPVNTWGSPTRLKVPRSICYNCVPALVQPMHHASGTTWSPVVSLNTALRVAFRGSSGLTCTNNWPQLTGLHEPGPTYLLYLVINIAYWTCRHCVEDVSSSSQPYRARVSLSNIPGV